MMMLDSFLENYGPKTFPLSIIKSNILLRMRWKKAKSLKVTPCCHWCCCWKWLQLQEEEEDDDDVYVLQDDGEEDDERIQSASSEY